jgi:hypothetical protein
MEKMTLGLNQTAALSPQVVLQTRLACSFPVTIKGFNLMGERYDEIALVENISRRGLCFKTGQALIPGTVFTLYKPEEERDPIAIFEVAWVKQQDSRIRLVGSQLLGDNFSWLRYLIEDVVLLQAPIIIRNNHRDTLH